MDILTAVQAKGVVLKKVSSTRGGEWAGPCPTCGGEDRFRCWPGAPAGKKAWFCRNCAEDGGDLIEFFRHYDGMGYKEACTAVGCEAKAYNYSKPVLPARRRRTAFTPSSHADPDELWTEKATKFVDQCHEQLLGNPAALDWLLEKRGINTDTVKEFRLGLNADKKYFRPRESWGLPTEVKAGTNRKKKLWIPRGLVIPYIFGGRLLRIRIRRPKEDLRSDADPRYYFVPGSSAAIMIIGRGRRAVMVLETELDGLMVHQEAGDLVQVIAMGTATSKPDTACAAVLKDADVLLISLDYDQAGAKGSKWWTEGTYPQALLWPPACGKDPGDMHPHVDVRNWVLAGLPPVYHVGSSALRSDTVRGAQLSEAPPCRVTEDCPVGGTAGRDLPATVRELGEMLQKYPLRINNGGADDVIDTGEGFDNPDVRARFEDLVFNDQECGRYLLKHHDSIIDGGNFFNG